MPTRDLIPVGEKFRDSVCQPAEPVLRMEQGRFAGPPFDGRGAEAGMDAEVDEPAAGL